MNIFTAEKINKRFVNHQALTDINLEIPHQSIFGLLGPNGAGKTTFIRIINQILAADSGRMFFNGEKLQPRHITQIGYLPEERGLYKKMKVGEQAIYLARLRGVEKHEAQKKLSYWFDKFDIKPWWNRKVEELSKGMQQKIQFVVTILHNPRLLIFDEPFSGFDPINVNLLKDEIFNLREKGSTIIFSTHNMASVEELCDHIALIDNSKLLLNGKVKSIKQNYKSGIYEVRTTENGKKIYEVLPDNFDVVSSVSDDDYMVTRISIPDESTPNELIELLIPHYEIYSFNEVLPGMNDIFIATVEKNKMER